MTLQLSWWLPVWNIKPLRPDGKCGMPQIRDRIGVLLVVEMAKVTRPEVILTQAFLCLSIYHFDVVSWQVAHSYLHVVYVLTFFLLFKVNINSLVASCWDTWPFFSFPNSLYAQPFVSLLVVVLLFAECITSCVTSAAPTFRRSAGNTKNTCLSENRMQCRDRCMRAATL